MMPLDDMGVVQDTLSSLEPEVVSDSSRGADGAVAKCVVDNFST